MACLFDLCIWQTCMHVNLLWVMWEMIYDSGFECNISQQQEEKNNEDHYRDLFAVDHDNIEQTFARSSQEILTAR